MIGTVSPTISFADDFFTQIRGLDPADYKRVMGSIDDLRRNPDSPGLRLKAFTLDAERQRATNFYVWESEAAAKAFFTDELTERITGFYGVRPRIDFVEIAALVDNAVSPAAA